MTYSNQEVQDMIEKFAGMLGHVRDTFIRGSELEAKVNGLETRVNELIQSVDHYTSQIATLDEALSRTRQERDEAKAQADQWREAHVSLGNEWQGKHNVLTDQHEALKRDYDSLMSDYQNLSQSFANTRTERDQALADAETARKELVEVKLTLDNIRKAMGIEQPRSPETGQFEPFPKAQGW